MQNEKKRYLLFYSLVIVSVNAQLKADEFLPIMVNKSAVSRKLISAFDGVKY
jgi:hypothetical protein